MKVNIVVLIVAYCLTGLSYVTRDMKEPAWNRPRALQTPGGAALMLLAWPIVAFNHSPGRAISHFLLFIIFYGIGSLLACALA